jgi:hypothetical protein
MLNWMRAGAARAAKPVPDATTTQVMAATKSRRTRMVSSALLFGLTSEEAAAPFRKVLI